MSGIRRQIVCALVLALALWASNRVEERAPRPLVRPLNAIPAQLDGWTSIDDPALDADVAAQLHATDYSLRTYQKASRAAGLFIAYYSSQRVGADIHPPKDCLPGNGWNIVDMRISSIAGKDKPISLYYIQKGEERRLVLYWYQSRERVMATEFAAKVSLFTNALRTGDTSGAVARVIVEDSPEALEAGARLASAIMTEIAKLAPDRCQAPFVS